MDVLYRFSDVFVNTKKWGERCCAAERARSAVEIERVSDFSLFIITN